MIHASRPWPLDDASHPSCVHDGRLSCLLTQPENRLPLRVEAGERLGAIAN